MPPLIAAWWIAFAAITAFRFIAAASLPLQGTEAYYWLWSEHLAAGYYDHPPLLAWCIRGGTLLLGQTELAVRLPSLMGVTGATLGVWWLARKMGDDVVAARAGLAATTLPYLSMQAVTAFADGIMLGLCMLSMCLAWRGRWMASGLALGLGLLAKFTTALVGVGTLLWSRSPRKLWPWALMAVLSVSPFLIWNAQNEWVTFAFQLVKRQEMEAKLQPFRFLEFLGLQALTVSPVLWVALLLAVWRLWRGGSSEGSFLWWHFAAPMAPFVAYSFLHKVEPQWPLVAYLPALVALGLVTAHRLWLASVSVGAVLTAFLLALGLFPQILFGIYASHREGASATQIFAFPEMGEVVREWAGDRFVMTQDHGYTSALQFYSGRPVHWFSYNLHGRQFLHWEDYASLKGQDALFVDTDDRNPEFRTRWLLQQAFTEVGPPERLTIYWNGRPARTFNLWPCRGFKGNPPDYTIKPPETAADVKR